MNRVLARPGLVLASLLLLGACNDNAGDPSQQYGPIPNCRIRSNICCPP